MNRFEKGRADIERQKHKLEDQEQALNELIRRAEAAGLTLQRFDELASHSLHLAAHLRISVPTVVVNRVADAVLVWVLEYVAARLAMQGVSHHLTDAAGETMVRAVLGDNIYTVLNRLP